jgi:SNF2 family DNA or RNA helicase
MDVTYVEFSPEERELYKAVEERARLRINKYLKEGTAPGNYSSILAMLVRLRQVVLYLFLDLLLALHSSVSHSGTYFG